MTATATRQPERIDYHYQSPEGTRRGSYHLWPCQGNTPERVLFCVHGLTRNARDFDYLARVLSQDYTVICPDVAGRGDSEWLTQPDLYGYPLYISQMVQLVQQVMAERRVTGVDWVGTSMGGLIGMMIAAQPVQPIRRMVMNDVGYRIPKAALERLATYVGKRTVFPTLHAAEAHLRTVAATFGPLTDDQWTHLIRTGTEPCEGGFRFRYDPAIAEPFRHMIVAEDVNLLEFWNQVRIPTLLIRGAQSDLFLGSTARDMASADQVELMEFDGIGHAPALMARDQIRAIRQYLTPGTDY